MSGIEVVGVVLAILPLAIEALKGYRAMLSRVRGADRDLKALIQDLETEQVRLQTTCEVLLDGIAPLSRIDAIVKEPFGTEWEQFNDNIRERLWITTNTFRELTKEMREAAEELGEKLCINEDGKTKLHSPKAILEECRKMASFSLRKRDYESIITRIKTANSVLHNLADANHKLEPSRRRRSQARVTKLIRGLSQSIFNALKSETACHCVQSHDMSLELVPRKAALVPSDVEDEVAKTLNFHVVLGSYESPDADLECSEQDDDRVKLPEQPTRWDSLRVQFEPRSEHTIRPPSSLSVPSINRRSPSPRPRVRFLELLGSRSGRESTPLTETLNIVCEENMVAKTSPFPTTSTLLSSGLCQVLPAWYKARRNLADPCCGYIADPHRTFGLYPQHYYRESRLVITLRQMLGEEHDRFQKLGLLEKLRVALAVSMGILHLYQTPWLARILTLDDVVFFQGNKTTYHPESVPRTFMPGTFVRMSGVAESLHISPQKQSRRPSKAVNLMLLSLGTMLIQVMIGRAEPALDMAMDPDMDLNAMMEKREAGLQLRNEVLEEVGGNCMTAVEWCLNSVLEIMGLDNEECCHSFNEGVVARLEKDVKQLSNRY